MKFFTKYSLFANVVSIVVIILAMLYIGHRALDGGVPIDKIPPKQRIELKAFDFHYNNYDKDGDLVTNFVSEELNRYLNENLKMINLTEKSYDKKTGKITWQISSKFGYVQQFTGQNLTHLYDGVHAILYTKSGEDKKDAQEDSQGYSPNKVYIKTSEMFYNSGAKVFYNDKFVKIYDPKTVNNTTAIGINGSSDTKIIKLNKNVRSYYATG